MSSSLVCPQCSAEVPARAKFCLECGTPLAGVPSGEAEVRKTVTALFCDVTGSTALGERMDPESFRKVMARFFEAMKPVLERHGGSVEKFIGDAITATFGIPEIHEDDALRAIRAAVEMRDALAKLNVELESRWGLTLAARTGINTGEVVSGEPIAGHSLVLGDAMNVAARLQAAAEPGDIYIGESTYRLVRDAVIIEALEPLHLKGKSEPVHAFRLIDVTSSAEGLTRRLDSPLVGRRRERAALTDAYNRSVRERSCNLTLIVGEPGMGKSRLGLEVAESVSHEATVATGRCLSYGEGITFWPINEIVRQVATIDDEDPPERAREKIGALLQGHENGKWIAERVAQVMGLDTSKSAPLEILEGLRAFFEALARRQPLVLILEDVHWAEPALIDALEHVVQTAEEAPLFLVCLARPEFVERYPDWAEKLGGLSLQLEPLSAAEADQLIRNLLGRATAVQSSDVDFIRSAEGNPLFLEHMISMLVEEGHLRLESGRWVPAADLSGLQLPPTIQALLASRIDRLPVSERTVLEAASILGKEFWKQGLVELCPPGVAPWVDVHLASLINKAFVQPDPSNVWEDDGFAFRHVLVREAAYDRVPKQGRADLHERAADLIQRNAGERLPEYDEIVGYNLEQSYQHRRDLGLNDEHTATVAARAAERLIEAGRRTARRGDLAAADNLLTRALDLLPKDSRERLELLMGDLALVLYARADSQKRLTELMTEFLTAADRLDDERLTAHAKLIRLLLLQQGDPATFLEYCEALVAEVLPVFERFGDDVGLGRAYYAKYLGFFERDRTFEAMGCLEVAIRHAERSDVPWEWTLIPNLAYLMYRVPIPIDDALARTERLLVQTKGVPYTQRYVLFVLSILSAMQGDGERARALVREAEALTVEFELDRVGTISAEPYILMGDLAAAEHAELETWRFFEEKDDPAFCFAHAAWLAEICCWDGRFDAAEGYVRQYKEMKAALNLSECVTPARCEWVHSRCLAERGYLAEALAASEEALEHAGQTDYLELQGNVLLNHGHVLRLAGRKEEARRTIQEAIQRFEQKGIVVLADKAHRMLDELPQASATT